MSEDRFSRLVLAHHGAVKTYARSMASSGTIADDAVQETFVRAWRYLDSFRGTGSFEGWLIRICRRCVFDLEASQRRRTVATPGVWPITPAEAADHSVETMAVLAGLSREHREVLVVCGILGYDYAGAATVLDLPIGTVRSRLHRARAVLAAAMTTDADAAPASDQAATA